MPEDTYLSEETPLNETSDAMKRPAVDLRAETYGTFGESRQSQITRAVITKESQKRPSHNIFSRRIMAIILALSIFTYHSMTYDHLLPIFFEDHRGSFGSMAVSSTPTLGFFHSPGGLGMSVQAVGMICAVNGVIALFIQAVIFPIAAERVGVYRLFIIVTVLHPIAYMLMPVLLAIPDGLLYPAIYLCLAVRNICSILVYPLLLIMLKEATPSLSVLGRVNGLAASAGAACRMIAPPGCWLSLRSRIEDGLHSLGMVRKCRGRLDRSSAVFLCAA